MKDANQKRVSALKAAAESKRLAVRKRILTALDEMGARNIEISFQSVAKYAQVSKTVLYANDDLSKKIKGSRDKNKIVKRMLDQESRIRSKDKEIGLLAKRIGSLEKEIRRLKLQLEIAYGELYKKQSVE